MLSINVFTARLFGKPIAIAVGSVLLYAALTYWVPRQLEANWMFKPLAEVAQSYAGTVSLAVLAYSLLLFLYATYEYWSWINGYSPSCPHCGLLMRKRNGRYGLFWGCLRYPSCRGTEDY